MTSRSLSLQQKEAPLKLTHGRTGVLIIQAN